MNNLNLPQPLLSLRQLAEYLQVCSATLMKMIKGGELRAVKVGGQWRVNKEWIDEKFKG